MAQWLRAPGALAEDQLRVPAPTGTCQGCWELRNPVSKYKQTTNKTETRTQKTAAGVHKVQLGCSAADLQKAENSQGLLQDTSVRTEA